MLLWDVVNGAPLQWKLTKGELSVLVKDNTQRLHYPCWKRITFILWLCPPTQPTGSSHWMWVSTSQPRTSSGASSMNGMSIGLWKEVMSALLTCDYSTVSVYSSMYHKLPANKFAMAIKVPYTVWSIHPRWKVHLSLCCCTQTPTLNKWASIGISPHWDGHAWFFWLSHQDLHLKCQCISQSEWYD